MTGTLGILFAVAVTIVVVYLLIKQYEPRTVLLAGGFLMAIAALAPLKAFSAFSTGMATGGLIQNICSCIGFALVLGVTGCDKHLIYSVFKALSKIRPVMIPGAAVATFFINIALPTAAGCSAAVGVILIPLLISQGVTPAMAASAVMLGTFGSVLSPGLMHNPMVAKIASVDVMEVIGGHTSTVLVCLAASAVTIAIVAKLLKEDKGYVSEEYGTMDTNFSINPLFAVLPILPVATLIVFSMGPVKAAMPWVTGFMVPHAMLLGSFLCLAFTRTNPQTAVRNFWRGMGNGYADVMGVVISAGVFISGLDALGAISAFLNFLRTSGDMVSITAGYGPFLLAVVSGSGDAATIAFNEAVTPHAADFGFQMTQMGSIATLSGALGRTMSPLAGAAIICAGIAKISPLEIAKRNAPAMLISSAICVAMLAY